MKESIRRAGAAALNFRGCMNVNLFPPTKDWKEVGVVGSVHTLVECVCLLLVSSETFLALYNCFFVNLMLC